MSRLPSEYTIQEASAKLGVPVQKLRRWDGQGVLVARRTDGGHRRYAREIIDGLAPARRWACRIDKYEDELATARKSLREKRRIIQLLLESESRYRDLVETSHDLIWTTDAAGPLHLPQQRRAWTSSALRPRTCSAAASSTSRRGPRTSPTAASSPR